MYLTDRKQTTCDCRRFKTDSMIHSFHFSSCHPIPSEDHRPRNTSSQKRISADIIKIVFVNNIDNWRNDHSGIGLNSAHQRLDPKLINFYMRIKKSKSISSSDHSGPNSSADQTFAFSIDDKLHFLKLKRLKIKKSKLFKIFFLIE